MKLVSKADYRAVSICAIVATLRGTDECVRPYTTCRADETRVAPDAFVRGCARLSKNSLVVIPIFGVNPRADVQRP
jgi:hypothetical protein